MAKSFFEKLTGASLNEDKTEEVIREEIKPQKPASERKIKKSVKKIEPIMEEGEEKNWLEEADNEEGQLTIDVYQTPSEIVIKSTVAGVRPEDIDISITNDMVTIRGRRKKEEEVSTDDYYYQELYWGTFSRSIILPVEVDGDRSKADIKNGILSIRLPKSEKIKTKKIKVNFD